jgi:bifunctional non-homologous end joining protein LigD
VFEPKYDGYRGMLYLAPGVAIFGSKRGIVLTHFRELAEAIHAQLGVRNAILDGEVVALNDEGQQDFGFLLRGQGRLHYAAFDLLWLNGRDLRSLPLVKRQQRLARLIPKTTPILSRVLVVEEDGRALFEAAQRLDLEGIVAKRKTDQYAPHTVWLKIKNPAYTQAEGRWELFGKRR